MRLGGKPHRSIPVLSPDLVRRRIGESGSADRSLGMILGPGVSRFCVDLGGIVRPLEPFVGKAIELQARAVAALASPPRLAPRAGVDGPVERAPGNGRQELPKDSILRPSFALQHAVLLLGQPFGGHARSGCRKPRQ